MIYCARRLNTTMYMYWVFIARAALIPRAVKARSHFSLSLALFHHTSKNDAQQFVAEFLSIAVSELGRFFTVLKYIKSAFSHCVRWQRGTTRVRPPHTALLCAIQQSIDISCRPGQTDGRTACSCSCSLAVLDPRVGHTMDVLSPFIPVLCHSDWLFHGKSCLRLDTVHPGRAWPSSPSCTWHCSLHYLFLQATPLFPHCVTIVC